MSSKISQNWQGNIFARVSFLIKRLWHRCFSVNFAKILRTSVLQNTSGRLLLKNRHTGIAGIWTQELDTRLWTQNFGRWALDAERQIVGIKTLKFKTVLSFGINGAIPLTSFLISTLIKIFGHIRQENLSMVYSFQATLSHHLKISNARGFLDDSEGEARLKMN